MFYYRDIEINYIYSPHLNTYLPFLYKIIDTNKRIWMINKYNITKSVYLMSIIDRTIPQNT